ncbi:MAG: family 20 glycosylhydrolase, partial [Ruminococcaceae bacterium]|nr:family 20 glycosylhydrolase [Oscillospiraceae bacterium]
LVPRGVKRENEENILGVECALWTEWVSDTDKMWFNLLPRLAAVSELSWTNESNRGYADFVRRLQSHYPFYEAAGLPYAHGKEKSGGLIKNYLTTKKWAFRDADIELKQ